MALMREERGHYHKNLFTNFSKTVYKISITVHKNGQWRDNWWWKGWGSSWYCWSKGGYIGGLKSGSISGLSEMLRTAKSGSIGRLESGSVGVLSKIPELVLGEKLNWKDEANED